MKYIIRTRKFSVNTWYYFSLDEECKWLFVSDFKRANMLDTKKEAIEGVKYFKDHLITKRYADWQILEV